MKNKKRGTRRHKSYNQKYNSDQNNDDDDDDDELQISSWRVNDISESFISDLLTTLSETVFRLVIQIQIKTHFVSFKFSFIHYHLHGFVSNLPRQTEWSLGDDATLPK